LEDAPQSVLAIDDSEETLLLLRVVLERAGFLVEAASSTQEATGKLRLRSYTVILLDLKMPHNGATFIDHVRSSFPSVLSKIVVLTASDPRSISEGVRRQVCGVLQKPLEIDQLVGVIRGCAASSNVNSYAG